jgi:multimeric flavodoxin WrbA
VKVALDAAKAVGPAIETELVELAGLNIPVFDPAAPGSADFEKVAAKLTDPKVAGILVGTPVYFGSMSSLCKAFLDRCIALRTDNFALANKVAGVVAVGGMRNGGQELTIQTVQAALLAQEMILVGDGRPTAHRGATLWNQGDDISKDELGLSTARNLGRRVAEVALALRGPA